MTKKEFIDTFCKNCKTPNCYGPDNAGLIGCECEHYIDWERERFTKFVNKYCKSCGSQRCLGPYDIEWFGGCTHREEMFFDNL